MEPTLSGSHTFTPGRGPNTNMSRKSHELNLADEPNGKTTTSTKLEWKNTVHVIIKVNKGSQRRFNLKKGTNPKQCRGNLMLPASGPPMLLES